MSTSYTDLTVLASGRAATPADELILAYIPYKNYDFLVTGIMAIVEVAATTAATLQLETYDSSPVTLATITIGTAAA